MLPGERAHAAVAAVDRKAVGHAFAEIAIIFGHLEQREAAGFGEPKWELTATDSKLRQAIPGDHRSSSTPCEATSGNFPRPFNCAF
jgi:hypothetical protein